MKRLSAFIARLILSALILSLAGCDVVRGLIGSVGIPTPFPTSTPYPTSTPQPVATVTFKVNVPPNTPAGSSINLILMDTVAGAANKTFILNNTPGANVWSTSLNVPIGSLVRYRYQRFGGGQVGAEVRADGGIISYRLALITAGTTIEETVAGWSDTPFVGDKGRITGIVRDASSNQGLPGMLVSAGGQLAVTGFDGEYVIWNLAANALTPVTVFAPDGSFRTQMSATTVPANDAAHLDFALNAAKTVNVAFVVALPAGTAGGAAPKIAANVLQGGETFVIGPGNSSIAPQRQATLSKLDDGRWATSLTLFEGTDLRYRYTLGSGALNGEIGSDGSPLVRQIILPGDDQIIVQDQVITWNRPNTSSVAFTLKAPASTPSGDEVTLQLKLNNVWLEPVAMWHGNDVTNWSYTLYNPLDFGGQAQYRFCRNYQCGAADDAATHGPDPAGFFFTPTLFPEILQNNVSAWKWWEDPQAPQITVPPIAPRQGFQAGVELAPWRPADADYVASTLDAVRGDNANWVRIPMIWDAPSANPPLISFDLNRSLMRADLIAAIRDARLRGFQVALVPQVSPALNGPYAGDINRVFEAGAKDGGWWAGWYREYARFLAYVADIATFTGANMMYIGDSSLARALPGGNGAPADAEQQWRGFIAAIRRDHFNGMLAFGLDFSGQSPGFTVAPPPFLDMVDVIDVRYSAALSPVASASLADLKTVAASQFDVQIAPLTSQFGNKLVVITAAYPSTDGGAANCVGIAAGSCQPIRNAAPDQTDSSLYQLDLNEQSLAYEALLYVIAERPWVAGFCAYGYNVPVSLRDKYYSPRGKPAETLIASWFARIK
jgi:hypothetical protein